jgi:hypothetical protein
MGMRFLRFFCGIETPKAEGIARQPGGFRFGSREEICGFKVKKSQKYPWGRKKAGKHRSSSIWSPRIGENFPRNGLFIKKSGSWRLVFWF